MKRFEGIRPYSDSEIPSAMRRIAGNDFFPLLSEFVFPGRPVEEVRSHVSGITTTAQFQHNVMAVFNEQVIRRSMTRFTYNGIERLDSSRRYLFVSNHRDIMLDSSLLQYILHINGHETSEITFGVNLMCNPLVIDIGKSNKMFKVVRGGNRKDFYRASLLNSEYIRYAITAKRQSVWIAQRNGRTKDGLDRTEPGLIRMFMSSGSDDKVQSLAELGIVPVSISYEWEPCDILKSLELYEAKSSEYVKKPGEDLNSILTGIMSDKGHVHIEICEPLSADELASLDSLSRQEYVKAVAEVIDRRINSAYFLHPNNYIAYDIRHASEKYSCKYSYEQKEAFCRRTKELSRYDSCDFETLSNIYLGIYANPVSAFVRATSNT